MFRVIGVDAAGKEHLSGGIHETEGLAEAAAKRIVGDGWKSALILRPIAEVTEVRTIELKAYKQMLKDQGDA